MKRIALLISLCLCSALGLASAPVELVFHDASERLVFENAVWPTQDPKAPSKVAGEKVSYRTTSDRNEDKIFVVDLKSGSVASKSIGEVRNGTWTISRNDYQIAYKVHVEVSNASGPISAASVELQDTLNKRTQLVDSSNKGTATFYFVKPGELKVTVSYNADGKTQDPVRQTFTLDAKREVTEPTFKVLVSGGSAAPGTATNAPPTASANTPAAGSATNQPAAPAPSAGGNIITTLIGLAIVGGIAYFIIQYMKKNDMAVKDVLTKLGADIPQPPSQDPDPVAHTPIAPQPMQQIILDPVATPDPIAPLISTPTVTGVPKLKSADGSAFELPEGETTVGREFGVSLVVPNETVSRNHASLVRNGNDIQVRDNGSTNGTWVNGVKVAGAQPLRPGDSVRFGSIEYRFEG